MKLAHPRVIKSWKHSSCFSMPPGQFLGNGAGRRFLPHDEAAFRLEAFAAFGLSNLADEPMFRNFIGNHFEDGARVHEHSDRAPAGYVHARYNWMVKKPQAGGDPVIDGEVVSVEEGDLWLCLASHERHASTPIFGGERIVYSFGALIPAEEVRRAVVGEQAVKKVDDHA